MPPHFHARYGDHKATVRIDNLSILDGGLPPRVMGLVVEWAALHRQELEEDWRLARELAPLRRIHPLE